MEPLAFLGLALALGVKHAYDADHLAAVGVFLGRATSARDALRLGLHWGAGHMLTAGLLTIALFLARDHVLSMWLEPLELVVAATLLLVGLATLAWETVAHEHAHRHGPLEHSHRHVHLLGRLLGTDGHRAMLGIGLLHGLASNDELLLLLTAGLGVASLGGLLAGVGAFSVGVIAGMALFVGLLGLPLVRARAHQVRRAVNVVAGAASIAVGASMLLPGLA
jgi:hypothetical protein